MVMMIPGKNWLFGCPLNRRALDGQTIGFDERRARLWP